MTKCELCENSKLVLRYQLEGIRYLTPCHSCNPEGYKLWSEGAYDSKRKNVRKNQTQGFDPKKILSKIRNNIQGEKQNGKNK